MPADSFSFTLSWVERLADGRELLHAIVFTPATIEEGRVLRARVLQGPERFLGDHAPLARAIDVGELRGPGLRPTTGDSSREVIRRGIAQCRAALAGAKGPLAQGLKQVVDP